MATTTSPLSPRSQAALDRFRAMTDQPHTDQAIDSIRRRVATFERIHEMSSSDMVAALSAGTIEETDDICSWLIQLDLLNRVTAER